MATPRMENGRYCITAIESFINGELPIDALTLKLLEKDGMNQQRALVNPCKLLTGEIS